MKFFQDNILFLISSIFLVGLIASASQLQEMHDGTNNPQQPVTDTTIITQTNENSSNTSASATIQTTTIAPTTPLPPTRISPVRRFNSEREGDDD